MMKTNKVGLLPYHRGMHDIEWLVHLPKPKAPGEEAHMKWGIARGTIRYKDDHGNLIDVRDMDMLHEIPHGKLENPWKTALNEAEEELGVVCADLDLTTTHDHGLVEYISENKPPYPIHFYSVHTKASFTLDKAKECAIDTQDIAFKTLDELREMAVHDGPPNTQFKTGYISIIEEIYRTVGK